jgi:uncharacterized protein YcbX
MFLKGCDMEVPTATIAHIYRYPVKGMSAEPLPRVSLAAGEGVPLDRIFGLAPPRRRVRSRAPGVAAQAQLPDADVR